jgi:LysR family transcriptional regulator, hca operon transcriptional activator
MDSRYMRYFIAVAEAKSFTHAAERLHTVQPSLSRQIKRLETIVGTPLFFRTKHEVRLTAAGEIFLRECRAILQQMDRAIVLAREGARAEAGHITIGFVHGTEKLFFDNLFPRLRERYSDMQITFRSFCEKDLFASLEDHLVDAAFLNGPYHDPKVATELFVHQQIIAALPASHPLSKVKKVPLAKLAELPLVGPDAELWPIYYEVIQHLAREAGVRFAMADTKYDSAVTSLHAVATGAGFSLIPDCRIDTFPHGAVARELDLNPAPRMELLLAYHKDKVSPALSLFLGVFQDYMKTTRAL